MCERAVPCVRRLQPRLPPGLPGQGRRTPPLRHRNTVDSSCTVLRVLEYHKNRGRKSFYCSFFSHKHFLLNCSLSSKVFKLPVL